MLFSSLHFLVRVNVSSRFPGDCEVLFLPGISAFRTVVVQRLCRYLQWRKRGLCCVCLPCTMLCCPPSLPAGIVSITTLTVLAYERYIRVVHARVINFSWAWRALTYIWLYSLAWSGAPLLGWNRYILDIHGLGCAVDWKSKDANDSTFVLFLFLGCLVVPMGVIAHCYGHILYSIRMVS